MKKVIQESFKCPCMISKKYNYFLQSSTSFINKHVYETINELELRVNRLSLIARKKYKLELETY